MFDWRQLQRWNVDTASLPAGSIIRFRDPTFWEQYRFLATSLLGSVIAEGLLIAWLLFLRRRRAEAEAENRELHSRLTEIVSNVPGVVWESRTDPQTGARRTTFISDYIQKLLGYSPAEWMQQPPGFGFRVMLDEDRDRGVEESESVMANGTDSVSEYRWRTKDGGVRWIENYLSPILDSNGKVAGIRGVALDVTDRKLAEEKAGEAEEKDPTLLAAIPDLMFLQSLDGTYLDYHAMDTNDLLVPAEKFVGKKMQDVLPKDLAKQFARCFKKTKEGEPPQILEYSLELGHSSNWFEARMVRSGDKVLSIVRDITDLKRSTQAAQELSGRLIKRAGRRARTPCT